jgi:hypothetical protein
LYSQLYADKEKKALDGPVQWFSLCDNALQVVKWALSGSERHAYEPDSDAVISIKMLIENYLLSRLPASHITEVKSMIDRVASLSGSDPVALLLRRHILKSASDAQGRSIIALQVSTLTPRAQLSSLSVTFTTTSVVNADLLRQEFPGRTIVGKVDVGYTRRIWSHDDYCKNVRNKVLGIVSGKRGGLILPVGRKEIEAQGHDQ